MKTNNQLGNILKNIWPISTSNIWLESSQEDLYEEREHVPRKQAEQEKTEEIV